METIGRYKILSTLGQGGMGTVYKAHDPLIDRIVAVKTITAQLDQDPDLRTRFMREARAAGQLSHKNIITIHDLGEEGGQIFIAMEFLEGEDLAAKVRNGPRMRFERKLEVIGDLCEGLAHAHSKGVVHRDLKPANVFVTSTGHVKILDFGLARMVASDLTQSQTTIGTPNYMSPEQVRGERVDHRSDIFSLGVVFYELLTSKRPFSGDSFASVIYKILQVEPEPIEVIDPTVPPEITAIVDRALAKDVGERYQHITDIQLDLKLFHQAFRSGRFMVQEDVVDGDTGLTGEWPTDQAGPRSESERRATPRPMRRTPTPSVRRSATTAAALPLSQSSSTEPLRSAWRTRGVPVVAALLIGAAGTWYVADRNRRPGEPSAGAAPSGAIAPSTTLPSSPDTIVKNLADASSALERQQFAEAARLARQVLEQQPGNADALSILERAKVSASAVEDKTAEAKSLIDAGRLGDASKLVGEALALSASDKTATELAARLGETARRTATDALGQMREAKTRAETARAQALAPRAYAAARDVEQQALGLYRSGRFGQAMGRLYETSGLYRSAEIQAHTEQMARDGAAAQRNADQVKPQELEAARGATETATAAPPPPPRPMQPANPPVPIVSEPLQPSAPTLEESRAPILSAVDRYRAALESKNIAAMKAIWTTLGPAEEQALRDEFRNARTLRVTIGEPAIQMAGESAVVRCRRGYEMVTVDGQRLQTATRTTVRLRRSGGVWLIEAVQHEPIH